MAKDKPKTEQLVRWDGSGLWLSRNGTIWHLGDIRTKQGNLTHEEKLAAVAAGGKWVKIR